MWEHLLLIQLCGPKVDDLGNVWKLLLKRLSHDDDIILGQFLAKYVSFYRQHLGLVVTQRWFWQS